MTNKPDHDPDAARQARLAAALRENLQKRKARDRVAAAAAPAIAAPPPEKP
jgi:hypothetical protein